MRYNKRFWAATFTLTGTIIGAGILGLPYVFAQSGFFVGFSWLIFLSLIVGYVMLCLGEVTLRTKETHQLPGYAEKYLGKKGEWVMFFAVVFGIYSALLAYLIGEGESLSIIFMGVKDYAIYFTFGFWILMTLLLREGLKGLKRVETYGVIAIIFIVLGLAFWYAGDINSSNLTNYNPGNLFFPFGVVLFALMGFTSIPELRLEIKRSEKKFRKAILFGILIPLVLYSLFSLVFVGVLGPDVPQVATLGFGKIVVLLGVFTMLTSYFVLSFSLKDIFDFDLDLKHYDFILVSLLPLVVYFVLYFFNMLNFVSVLSIGGVISGGFTAILILMMNYRAKKMGNRKPEFSVPINWFVVLVLSLVFLFGIWVQVFG